MKFSLNNLLAIASMLVWATAWAATEKNAVSAGLPSLKVETPAQHSHSASGTLHVASANN